MYSVVCSERQKDYLAVMKEGSLTNAILQRVSDSLKNFEVSAL